MVLVEFLGSVTRAVRELKQMEGTCFALWDTSYVLRAALLQHFQRSWSPMDAFLEWSIHCVTWKEAEAFGNQMPNLFSFTTQQQCWWLAACRLPERLRHIRSPVKRRLGTPLNWKRSRKMLWAADTWQRWRSHHENSDWLGRWRSQLLWSWGCSLLRGGISSHQTSCQVGKIMETWIRNVT